MGLLIGIIRRRQLSMMKSNLQWKLHLITAAIATASKAATNLMQVGTDYESDDLISKKLQQRQYKLKLLEEKLTNQKAEVETRLQEITAELQSNQGMIDQGVQTMFSYKVG